MARESDDEIFAFLLGMVLGAAGGSVAALLFAPGRGDDLRRQLKIFLKNLPDRIEDEMNPYSSTRQFIDRTRYSIENRVDEYSHKRRARNLARAKEREEMASGLDY